MFPIEVWSETINGGCFQQAGLERICAFLDGLQMKVFGREPHAAVRFDGMFCRELFFLDQLVNSALVKNTLTN